MVHLVPISSELLVLEVFTLFGILVYVLLVNMNTMLFMVIVRQYILYVSDYVHDVIHSYCKTVYTVC